MRILFCVLAMLAASAPVWGQDPGTGASAPRPVAELLPGYDFRIGLEHLSGGDQRFVWDAHYGGVIGLVRYRGVRLDMVADYEAMLGSEYQPFDPLQGNYALGGSLGGEVRGLHVDLVMHHLSRHLGDRAKRDPIAWNMYGGRVRQSRMRGALRLDSRALLRFTTNKAYVDYEWEAEGGVDARYRIHPKASWLGGAEVRRIGVDGSRNRGGQTGFRAEGGIRLDGRAGDLELLVAYERRIDPYQLEFGTASWLMAGFRVVSH
jgi:hypothetical protein